MISKKHYESLLLYDLVRCINKGGINRVNAVEIAEKQLAQMKEKGHNLEIIYECRKRGIGG